MVGKRKIMDAIAQLWWGDDDNSNKMHWLAWWKLCYPINEGGMGFRDFESFNLAMLAKQVWRLISDPSSLCARVLRAKYYPDGNILRAGLKTGCFFTWQSIVAGITTFKRGYIWRVGNGENINIWNDPWIQSSADYKVTSQRGAAVYMKVSELINPVTGQWDTVLLDDLFNSCDVGRILQILLHNQGFKDFIAWGANSHGRYTVKSGYYLQWKHRYGVSASALALPGSLAMNLVWKILWKLKIPSKINFFMWRDLHGIMPLKCILINRHIGDSGSCPPSNQGAEDIMHLLFCCPPMKEMWCVLGLEGLINEAASLDRSGSAVLEYILRR
jgi:hypothetical protein